MSDIFSRRLKNKIQNNPILTEGQEGAPYSEAEETPALTAGVSNSTAPVAPSTPVSTKTNIIYSKNDLEIKDQIVKDIRENLPEEFFRVENESKLDDKIRDAIKEKDPYMSISKIKMFQQDIKDDLLGYGPLESLLRDDEITEIMIVGSDKIFIEKAGSKFLADAKFKDYEHVRVIIDKIIGPIGRKIDEQTPYVDARLPQGFRLNAVIKPISLNGPFVTIRKFPKKVWLPEDLIKFGSAPEEVFEFLKACVLAHKNMGVSGGTGSGKTTLLNVLSNYIQRDERIIVIEDCAELRIVGDHVLNHETRPSNIEGKGEISIRDLVRNALRQRPDRIVVGEVRGAEAMDMLQAMNTGHAGSLTTGHANTPLDFLRRLEYMCLMGGADIPLRALREQISSAMEVVVQIGRVRINGKPARRILEISEIVGLDKNMDYIINTIYESKFKGTNTYGIRPTGNLPSFADELEEYFDLSLLKAPEKEESI